MKYKEIKENILFLLNNNDLSSAKKLFFQIKKITNYDIDFKFISAYISYMESNLKKAEYICNNILNIIPLHFNTYVLLTNIYMSLNKHKELIELFFNIFNFSLVPYLKDDIRKTQNAIIMFFKEQDKNNDYILLFLEEQLISAKQTFRPNSIWGRPMENFLYKEINDYYFSSSFTQSKDFFNNHYKNLRLIAFKKYNNFTMLKENCTYILPFHSKQSENILSIKNPINNTVESFILDNYNYYLFNINSNYNFSTTKDIFIGNPIPNFKFNNNKDLILTLFIDGLSQTVIEENGGLKKLMPHTYNFFKDYMYCDNFYTTGEWTYPSIASYFTGQYTTKHNLFHPNINISLKKDTKILSEYINNKNYFSSKIDGDWRSCFPYGYHRGFDYICYEPSIGETMNAKEISSLLIDHIETFKSTNMFIHTCIADLHDIADGHNLYFPIQAKESYEEKPINSNYVFGETSVRNNYDENKIKSYIRMMKYIDIHLRSLYCYLEDNFNLDNVTVALISDHGQGFLVKPDEEFLSDGRIKVPFLIRSKETKGLKCNELMQNVDYIAVLDKILNLGVNYKNIDANLPSCLGGKERKYTYSESLFPDAPYRSLINTKEYEFFFETKENVQLDGRVLLDDYRTHLKNRETKEDIENDEILKKCINTVFDHMKYHRIYI